MKESKEDKDIKRRYRYAVAREVLEEYERLPSSGDLHDYSYLKQWLRRKINE